MPDAGHMHDGTWGCNGEYHWRAFSNGKDKHRAKYPNIEQNVHADLSTEAERALGKIVKDKFGTDFYILHRFFQLYVSSTHRRLVS